VHGAPAVIFWAEKAERGTRENIRTVAESIKNGARKVCLMERDMRELWREKSGQARVIPEAFFY